MRLWLGTSISRKSALGNFGTNGDISRDVFSVLIVWAVCLAASDLCRHFGDSACLHFVRYTVIVIGRNSPNGA